MTELSARRATSGVQVVPEWVMPNPGAIALAIDILQGGGSSSSALEKVADYFGELDHVDAVVAALTTFAPTDDTGWLHLGQRAWVREWAPPDSQVQAVPKGEAGPDAALTMPWMSQRARDEVVTIADAERLPPEAAQDRVELLGCGVRAIMNTSQMAAGVMFGSLSVVSATAGDWPEGHVGDMRLLSAALTSRMAAEQAERSLADAIARGDQASQGQEHFFAAVGHELRTPISAILGFAEMLRDEAGELGAGVDPIRLERFPGAVARDTGIILKAGEQLLAIVEDLLTTGRTLGDQEREAVLVADAVQDVIHWVRTPARSRRIRVSSDIPTDLTVRATASGLRQVLTNLVGNAVVHNAEGGSVSISATTTYDGGEPRVRISVRDDGPGLDAEQQQAAFEPFVRFADASVRGTGLGLALSRSVAERDGGLLGVDSRPGRGSTFWLDLPAG